MQLVAQKEQYTSLQKEVIDKFHKVFEKIVGLPPMEAFDHHIPLKEYTSPILVRPNR